LQRYYFFRQLYCFLAVLFIAQGIFAIAPNFYFSPGVRLGWSFGGGLTLGAKISFGVYSHDEFANITFGGQNLIFAHAQPRFENHAYADIEGGLLVANAVYGGGGLGCIFYDRKIGLKVAPRVTSFIGYGLFPTLDLLYVRGLGIKSNLGLQGVVPIPINHSPIEGINSSLWK
jgi:hypothetical protein